MTSTLEKTDTYKKEPLVTAQEIAEILGVTEATVRGWAREGRIPSLRLTPRTVRFVPSRVFAALGVE